MPVQLVPDSVYHAVRQAHDQKFRRHVFSLAPIFSGTKRRLPRSVPTHIKKTEGV
jgi:hypothetical protein